MQGEASTAEPGGGTQEDANQVQGRGRAAREVTAGPLLSAVAEGLADGEREGQPRSRLGSGVSAGREHSHVRGRKGP